ncbi:MAG: phosphatidylserine decarboxylase [Phycisphaerae bacterium]
MRISGHGTREIVILTLLLGAAAVGTWFVHAALTVVFGLMWLAVLAFFRDPHRRIPDGAGLLVAPGDGRITEVTDLDHYEGIDGPALRVGIFLSVLDVHVNRSPCAGRVIRREYRPGEYLDARHPESGARNESNTLTIQPAADVPGPVIVRQIAGMIARRIVCAVQPGDRLDRGQRIGLIKFGSRVELIVPRVPGWRVGVGIGDRVAGGSTVLLQYQGVPRADETSHEDREPIRQVETAAR